MPTTPAGRLAQVEELLDNGLIDSAETHELTHTTVGAILDEMDQVSSVNPVHLGVDPSGAFDENGNIDRTRYQTWQSNRHNAVGQLDTAVLQSAATGIGDYLMTIPDTMTVNTGVTDQRRSGYYEGGYTISINPEVARLEAKVKELEEKLKATVAFYEGMVDEELGGS